MTSYRIAAIRARVDTATAGPWEAKDGALLDKDGWPDGVLSCCNVTDETIEFIAHAREDVPWLLARIETLAAALVAADRLLDYVRPILHEAIGERGRVHGLSFETAVGDACDLIDTRERAALDGASEASSTSQGDAGQE